MIKYLRLKDNKALVTCLSSDTKPTAVTGYILIEEDTGDVFYESAAAWVKNTTGGGGSAWGSITGTLSNQTDLDTALNGKQATLVSATNIKTINGSSVLGSGDLVVSGTDSTKLAILNNLSDLNNAGTARTNLGLNTTANQTDSTNKRFITDAQQTVLSNTSGTNTGDNATNTQYSGLAASKQDTLVSATNIKTINGSSVLGSGDLVVSSGYHLVATLSGDQATGANVTPVTLTGLVFSYAANSKYRIWFMGNVAPTAATTGCGFQFDLSSAVTSISVRFSHQLANTGTLSGGHSIADDASVGVSSGMPGTSTYPVSGEGILITGANTGTAQLRFRSETTAVTTCKSGFTLVIEKIS